MSRLSSRSLLTALVAVALAALPRPLAAVDTGLQAGPQDGTPTDTAVLVDTGWPDPSDTLARPQAEPPAETGKTVYGPMRDAVEAILSDPELPSGIWGLYAVDLSSGQTILSRNAGVNLLPASTMKLLTTATALVELGPDFRYTTRLYHLGETSPNGLLSGDLVIRGDGDPTFGSEWISGDPLQDWADALAEAGVRRVQGRIIGDDDRFADEPYAEGWDVSHIATETYAPPSGGLSWADNLLNVRIAGGRATVNPPGLADVVADIGSNRRGRLSLRRVVGTNQISLSGSIPSGYRGTIELPVENPTLYTAYAFADALRDAGIAVDAQVLDADDLARKPSYEGQEPLRATVSPRLAEIVERVNKRSDNLYAENLFRTLTPAGTLSGGASRVRALLRDAGAQTSGLSIKDGSGLSRKDLITPAAMGAMLRYMHQHPTGGLFRSTLPGGGMSGSTLRNRLSGVPVRAKTGSLSYVRCLSGYVRGPQDQQIAFVVMANNYTQSGGRITGAIDDIVRALHNGRRVPRPANDDIG